MCARCIYFLLVVLNELMHAVVAVHEVSFRFVSFFWATVSNKSKTERKQDFEGDKGRRVHKMGVGSSSSTSSTSEGQQEEEEETEYTQEQLDHVYLTCISSITEAYQDLGPIQLSHNSLTYAYYNT